MGFFVGWRYFNHNNLYHWEAQQERRRLEGIEKRKKAAAAKRRKKIAAKKKAEKAKKQEEWRKEADKNMREGEERFSQHGLENGIDGTDLYSNDYSNNYKDEIAERYGAKKYNPEDTKKVNIKRGMGSGHHMSVKEAGQNRYQGHSALGSQGGAKLPPGMDAIGMQVDQAPVKYRGGGANSSGNIGGSRQPTNNSNQAKSSGNNGGSSQLFNPFGGGGGNGSKLFRF